MKRGHTEEPEYGAEKGDAEPSQPVASKSVPNPPKDEYPHGLSECELVGAITDRGLDKTEVSLNKDQWHMVQMALKVSTAADSGLSSVAEVAPQAVALSEVQMLAVLEALESLYDLEFSGSTKETKIHPQQLEWLLEAHRAVAETLESADKKRDMINFGWDVKNEDDHWGKHPISFKDARSVFKDRYAITEIDDRFDYGEVRYWTLGMVENRCLVLYVAHTIHEEGHSETIWIISAREANAKERKLYDSQRKRKEAL